jgi:hypothetical protein
MLHVVISRCAGDFPAHQENEVLRRAVAYLSQANLSGGLGK